MCLHALAEDRDETRRFTDFLDNEAVTGTTPDMPGARLPARGRAARAGIADTSEMTSRPYRAQHGFGTVGNGKDIGVFLHPIIAVDADRADCSG